MSAESWQDDNNRYLAASFQWLRLRLQQLAPEDAGGARSEPVPPVSSAPSADKGLLSRWRGGAPPAPETAPPPPRMAMLPAKGTTTPADAVKQAAAAREAAAQMDPPPALLLLANRMGLSPFERDVLLMCAAVEFDPGMTQLCARAQGNPALNYPTFGLAMLAFEQGSWEEISTQRPLRHARLIEISQPGATPLSASALRADERIVNFLKGLNVPDERLTTLLTELDPGESIDVAESQHAVADTVLQRLRDSPEQSVLPVVQLVGGDSGSKLAVAREVCAALKRQLYRAGVESLPPHAEEIETLARLWQRETFLLPVALYLDAENLGDLPAEVQSAFNRFLSRGVGVIFLSVRDTPVRLNGATFPVDVERPTPAEQHEAWAALLGAAGTGTDVATTAQMLTGQFDLNLTEIRELSSFAAKGVSGPGDLNARLWSACRDRTRPRLDTLAQRLDVKATWDDLILPPEQMTLMRQIAEQVRERHKVYGDWGFSLKMNRGFGITALFAGESGVGKTMAAEVIAKDLNLNLYRIDLSAVVSKYIGETEKNLRRLFDAAEQGGAILFFDEADALFGKRSEVKDSHDRYANIEINYLLQRMEAFTGLAILATNRKTALDPAFMRRLRFIVNFPFPGVQQRQLIWQKVLPAQAPQETLDFSRLAKLNLAGASIHSIALNAAFLAAGSGTSVNMSVLLAAARTELKKLDKPVSEADLKA
jgi:hypothetical protein